MKLLSFDLELNQDPITGPRIIEIGACIGDVLTGEILTRYSIFVNPKQPLTEEIITLTGIKPSDLEHAGDIEAAYQGMVQFAKVHDCTKMPLVWGMGDGQALRNELANHIKWKFGRRELDVKAVFQAYQMSQGKKFNFGLAHAMEALNLTFQGVQHRALDDAINTFLLYHTLLKRFHSPLL